MYSNTTKKNQRYAKNTTLRGGSIESPRTLEDLRNSIDRAIEEYSGGEGDSDLILQAKEYEEISQKKYKGGAPRIQITSDEDKPIHDVIGVDTYKHTIKLTRYNNSVKLNYKYEEQTRFDVNQYNNSTYIVDLSAFYITTDGYIPEQTHNDITVQKYTVAVNNNSNTVNITEIVQVVAIVVSVCYINVQNAIGNDNTILKWLFDNSAEATAKFNLFADTPPSGNDTTITITFLVNKGADGVIKVYDPTFV
jgi:hypothetical protein